MLSKSYRFRLILYSSLLVIFLSATLIFSYKNTRDVVLTEVKNNLDRTVQLFDSQLVNERSELKRYSNIVSDDLRIQEYMFVAVRVGSDSKPLKKLYDRLFGWLPIDRKVIVSDTGQALVGGKHTDLVDWVNTYKHQVMGNVYYRESEDSLELVAISPIVYQDDQLGFVAVTQSLDENWLYTHKQNSNGHLFLTKDGNILQSTLTNTTSDKIKINNGKLHVDNEVYFTYPIKLPIIDKGLPRLWFAISETRLLKTLSNHGQITLILITAGSAVILWLGVLIFRNFSKPIAELMTMTHEISEGRLPRMAKSQAQNEIGVLANNFADMLHALREKQAEIDRVHKRLEMTSITDTLTGMYNRRHLQELFPKLCGQARRDWRNISGIILDLDHFKKINDDHGHLAGDQVLINFSDILKKHLRSNDFLFRLGGEEFLLISINKDESGSVTIAEKIRTATEKSIVTYNGIEMSVTVSCGISSLKPNQSDNGSLLPALLSQADEALYEAKNLGRNRVCVYTGKTEDKVQSITRDQSSNT
jgi:diguanylate cyclase (GGDEF)-like protein